MQPVLDSNRQWTALFIFFMLFGSFFVTNLFVGVVVDNFTTMKEKLGEDFLLSGETFLAGAKLIRVCSL